MFIGLGPEVPGLGFLLRHTHTPTPTTVSEVKKNFCVVQSTSHARRKKALADNTDSIGILVYF